MTPEHAAHDMLNRAQAGTVEVFEDGADLEAAKAGADLLVTAAGSVRFEQDGQVVTASEATLRLLQPSNTSLLVSLTPTTLTARGGVRYTDPLHHTAGTAGSAEYTFSTQRLRLTGTPAIEQTGSPAATHVARHYALDVSTFERVLDGFPLVPMAERQEAAQAMHRISPRAR